MNREPVRTLQIETVGDFFLGKIKPRIRLNGHWLACAGFPPGQRVTIELVQPGLMTLRCVECPPDAKP